MKSMIVLLTTSFLWSGCLNQPIQSQDILVRAALRGDYELPQTENTILKGTNHFYIIEIELLNNGNSPFEFPIYSCSAIENFVIDNKDFRFCYNTCRSNSKGLIKMEANSIFRITALLQVSSEIKNREIRIGFIPIDKDKVETYSEELIARRNDFRDVLWSESLSVFKGKGHVFDIYKISDKKDTSR